MNERELFDRLIGDIKSSIDIRKQLPSIDELKAMTTMGHDTTKLFQSSLNTTHFDDALSNIIPIINNLGQLINVKTPIDLENVLEQLTNNSEEIIERFKKYLNENRYIFAPTTEPIGRVLVEQLENLNRFSK